jgi:hypothetical protein
MTHVQISTGGSGSPPNAYSTLHHLRTRAYCSRSTGRTRFFSFYWTVASACFRDSITETLSGKTNSLLHLLCS